MLLPAHLLTFLPPQGNRTIAASTAASSCEPRKPRPLTRLPLLPLYPCFLPLQEPFHLSSPPLARSSIVICCSTVRRRTTFRVSSLRLPHYICFRDMYLRFGFLPANELNNVDDRVTPGREVVGWGLVVNIHGFVPLWILSKLPVTQDVLD